MSELQVVLQMICLACRTLAEAGLQHPLPTTQMALYAQGGNRRLTASSTGEGVREVVLAQEIGSQNNEGITHIHHTD
jgi:hypothetical protein